MSSDQMKEANKMFKKFVAELVAAKTEDEVLNVFYNENGIDRAFQQDKITWKDHQALLDLVNKLCDLMKKEA